MSLERAMWLQTVEGAFQQVDDTDIQNSCGNWEIGREMSEPKVRAIIAVLGLP